MYTPIIKLIYVILQLNGQSDKEIADEYFVKNSEVRQAQVSMHAQPLPLIALSHIYMQCYIIVYI